MSGGADARPEADARVALGRRLKAQALGLGFDLAGIAALGRPDTLPQFERWLAEGRHAGMDYLLRGAALRADARRPADGMRSALVVALDYGGRQPPGPVARYARGTDYHRVMWDRLDELHAWLRAEVGADVPGRAYVDSGPVLERDLARKAGLGWFGKNTLLINPTIGSFFFIGALFVGLDLPADEPFAEDHCGSCRRCLDACPTGAFPEPRVLDANRCISYLTIEHRGEFSDQQAAMVGDHLFGCDICQDVCPWNVKFAREPRDAALAPRPELVAPDLAAFAALDDETFRARYRDTPLARAKALGLRRNAQAARRNADAAGRVESPDPDHLPPT